MTYGPDRTEALSTMAKALDSYVIRGEKVFNMRVILYCDIRMSCLLHKE